MDWWLMLLGAVISAGIGWLFAWNSSKRITKTHEKLTWLMRGLEEKGVATFTHDEKGEISGVVINARADISTAHITMTTHPVVVTAEPTPVDEGPADAQGTSPETSS